MRFASLGVLAAGLAVVGCLYGTGPNLDHDIPPWLEARISELASEPVTNPPMSVTEFTYRDRTTYYIPARCCDFASQLYDATGKLLCAPDGGITGAGDGRCTDFAANSRRERLIWADPRKP